MQFISWNHVLLAERNYIILLHNIKYNIITLNCTFSLQFLNTLYSTGIISIIYKMVTIHSCCLSRLLIHWTITTAEVIQSSWSGEMSPTSLIGNSGSINQLYGSSLLLGIIWLSFLVSSCHGPSVLGITHATGTSWWSSVNLH